VLSLVNRVGLLIQHPGEIRERVRNRVAVWSDRSSERSSLTEPADANRVETTVAELFGATSAGSDDSWLRIERYIEGQQTSRDADFAPFQTFHDGTVTLGRLCYHTCRQLNPRTVVETGVAYGVTSTYILRALADNRKGILHSIDLPPLAADAEQHVGRFVPEDLRDSWRLHIGSAKELLPKVLTQARTIDMFVHDSLHTYAHMKWEFDAALSVLTPGGVVIADDIENNRAFEELAHRPEIQSWAVLRQEGKTALCGIAVTKADR